MQPGNFQVQIDTFQGRLASLTITALLAALAGCQSEPSAPPDPPEDPLTILDLDGQPVDPFAFSGAKAAVFLFTRTDCPISNRYAPEVRRLHEKFVPQGVAFALVYVDPAQPVEEIRAHLEEYDYPCRAWRDPEHRLVERSGASITPEAAVFVPDGGMPYRGRIDNRFADFGETRAAPTKRDLEDALMAILDGRPVETATTEAVGCYIDDLK